MAALLYSILHHTELRVALAMSIWEFPKVRGTFLGILIIRTIVYIILGSILGFPYFGKVPYVCVCSNSS